MHFKRLAGLFCLFLLIFSFATIEVVKTRMVAVTSDAEKNTVFYGWLIANTFIAGLISTALWGLFL